MSVRSLLRLTIKMTASVALLAIFAGESAPRQSAAEATVTGNHVTVAASDYYPMVHLRKLHLVRPDLIPFPIYYSVYC